MKLDTFPAGVQTIYYYYGNSSAQNGFSSANFPTVASNYSIGALGSEKKSLGPVTYWKFDVPPLPNRPDLAVNLLITLIHQTNYLIDKLIDSLKTKHMSEGELSEELYRKRVEYRSTIVY